MVAVGWETRGHQWGLVLVLVPPPGAPGPPVSSQELRFPTTVWKKKTSKNPKVLKVAGDNCYYSTKVPLYRPLLCHFLLCRHRDS